MVKTIRDSPACRNSARIPGQRSANTGNLTERARQGKVKREAELWSSEFPLKSKTTRLVSVWCRAAWRCCASPDTRSSLRPAPVIAGGFGRAWRRFLGADAVCASALPDHEYQAAGAILLDSAQDVWRQADLVVKVKEPQPAEYAYFRPGVVLATYLHLAPLPGLTEALVRSGVTSIAYETVREADGRGSSSASPHERSGRPVVGSVGRAVPGEA